MAEVVVDAAIQNTNADTNTSHATCGICLNDYTSNVGYMVTGCGHKFHLDCLMTNYQQYNKPNCPLCNQAVFGADAGEVAAAHPHPHQQLHRMPMQQPPLPQQPQQPVQVRTAPVYSRMTAALLDRLRTVHHVCRDLHARAEAAHKRAFHKQKLDILMPTFYALVEMYDEFRVHVLRVNETFEFLRVRNEFKYANDLRKHWFPVGDIRWQTLPMFSIVVRVKHLMNEIAHYNRWIYSAIEKLGKRANKHGGTAAAVHDLVRVHVLKV